jgi:hypothetical protein
MTLPIPDKTLARIRGLLEYRNLIEAIRVYRGETGCSLKEAKDSVEQLQREFRQQDPERFGGIETTAAPTGSMWTLIGGLAVFIAILSTVYAYVFPRLSGEPVSATASVEIRAAYQEASDDCAEMILPDGGKWYIAKDVLLAAGDFRTFRSVQDKTGVPQLTLHLSASGRKNLKLLKSRPDVRFLALIIHQDLVACIELKEWSAEGITVTLNGLSSSDANELYARLTE